MNKKLLSILSILFLSSLLMISCNIKLQDSTSPTGSIDAKWRGTYETATDANNASATETTTTKLADYIVNINSDGILVVKSTTDAGTIIIDNGNLTKESDDHYKSNFSEYTDFRFAGDTLTITKSDSSKISLIKIQQ